MSRPPTEWPLTAAGLQVQLRRDGSDVDGDAVGSATDDAHLHKRGELHFLYNRTAVQCFDESQCGMSDEPSAFAWRLNGHDSHCRRASSCVDLGHRGAGAGCSDHRPRRLAFRRLTR